MNYFLVTMETVPDGVGFELFGSVHIAWLAAFVVVTILNCLWYRRLPNYKRRKWQLAVVGLLLIDEMFKIAVLLAGGNYTWSYLPLHLCSVNIFLILWHVVKPSEMLGNFLYAFCIPGAIAALLFPMWTSLPTTSALHFHSFTTHILLALYPIVLTVSGEIQPEAKQLPMCLLSLLLLAIPVYGLNLLLGTNFMFLMWAPEGNPLCWFAQKWGNHLTGFPVITVFVLLVMYLPITIYRRNKRN